MSAYPLTFQDTIIECEDAKDRAIRWAVGSIDGPRGATWRLWGHKKGDVYLAARSITGEVKASFRPDRKCHLGFTGEYFETASTQFPGLTSRHWDRWTIPHEPVVRALQIVLPALELRSWMVKLNASPSGGLKVDPNFFVEFDDYRAHQIRLEGGDCSSDSYCYP